MSKILLPVLPTHFLSTVSIRCSLYILFLRSNKLKKELFAHSIFNLVYVTKNLDSVKHVVELAS